MTKVEDRTVLKLAKEALLADGDGLKKLFRDVPRDVPQEVREAEMCKSGSNGQCQITSFIQRAKHYRRGGLGCCQGREPARAGAAGAMACCLQRAFFRTPYGILDNLDPLAKLAAKR